VPSPRANQSLTSSKSPQFWQVQSTNLARAWSLRMDAMSASVPLPQFFGISALNRAAHFVPTQTPDLPAPSASALATAHPVPSPRANQSLTSSKSPQFWQVQSTNLAMAWLLFMDAMSASVSLPQFSGNSFIPLNRAAHFVSMQAMNSSDSPDFLAPSASALATAPMYSLDRL